MEHPHQQRLVPHILMLLYVYSCRKGGMLKGSNISITEDMSRWAFYGVNCFFHGQLFSDEFERLGLNWESSSASQKRWVDTVLEKISNQPIKKSKNIAKIRQTQLCPAICSMTRLMSTEGKIASLNNKKPYYYHNLQSAMFVNHHCTMRKLWKRGLKWSIWQFDSLPISKLAKNV